MPGPLAAGPPRWLREAVRAEALAPGSTQLLLFLASSLSPVLRSPESFPRGIRRTGFQGHAFPGSLCGSRSAFPVPGVGSRPVSSVCLAVLYWGRWHAGWPSRACLCHWGCQACDPGTPPGCCWSERAGRSGVGVGCRTAAPQKSAPSPSPAEGHPPDVCSSPTSMNQLRGSGEPSTGTCFPGPSRTSCFNAVPSPLNAPAWAVEAHGYPPGGHRGASRSRESAPVPHSPTPPPATPSPYKRPLDPPLWSHRLGAAVLETGSVFPHCRRENSGATAAQDWVRAAYLAGRVRKQTVPSLRMLSATGWGGVCRLLPPFPGESAFCGHSPASPGPTLTLCTSVCVSVYRAPGPLLLSSLLLRLKGSQMFSDLEPLRLPCVSPSSPVGSQQAPGSLPPGSPLPDSREHCLRRENGI